MDESLGNSAATHGGALGVAPLARRSRRERRSFGFEHTVEEQMRVLGALRANLTVHHETLEDPELMLVLADGETDLLELLDLMLEADLNDEALISGLKTQKDTLAVRLHRLQERRESRRSILEQALMLLERKSLERPVATLTLSNRPPQLVVDEEAQIPARFFDLKPVLNKRLTKEALEAGEEVPGTRLSNGSVTLTLRRR
jgi:hypothetical protein